MIDSGISPHNDLNDSHKKSRLVYSESFVNYGTPDFVGATVDQYGHGTHVAGIIGGSGDQSDGNQNSVTFKGIAPNANLINLRVLDKNGVGRDSDVIAAIERAIQLKSQYNIRIINLSLGRSISTSYKNDVLCQAVEEAWKAGIVVVVAAGNYGRDTSMNTEGYGTITAPGNDPYALTVGAMKDMSTASRTDDLIASYSSKGPSLIDHVVKPDIVAPGNLIISLQDNGASLEKQFPGNAVARSVYIRTGNNKGNSTDYFILSGTSMAAPMVSGAAALLLEQDPSLTPDQAKARLMKTASKGFPAFSLATDPATGKTYRSQYDIFTIGAGYLDLAAALANSDKAPLNAISPTAVYNSTTKTVSIMSGDSVTWGSSVLWGTSIVWGSNVFVSGASVLWGSSVCWGSGTTQGFSVVWGNTAPAATSLAWGTTTPTGQSVLISGEK